MIGLSGVFVNRNEMPKRPPRPCGRHSWIMVNDGKTCPECAKSPMKTRMSDRRPSASQRGYGSEHRKKRDALIQRVKWCADPYGYHQGKRVPGTIRDHVVPLKRGGSDDQANEQLLCVKCHNAKMYKDGSRGKNVFFV